MKETKSEISVSKINSFHFFKEFTFSKNEFVKNKNILELSDNIIWIDDLMFFIQIKERNSQNATGNNDKWFLNKVLNKAKKQIKDTHKYLNEFGSIPIVNKREQKIKISLKDNSVIHNLILYSCELNLEKKNRDLKFTISKKQGFIHIFEIKIYNFICEKLITPIELSNYLNFRKSFINFYKNNIYSEYYILSHFIHTEDVTLINFDYLNKLEKINSDFNNYNFNEYLQVFYDRIISFEMTDKNNYRKIMSEIAKLKRYELSEFLLRFNKSIEHCKKNEEILPYQFVNENNSCGFVFFPIQREKISDWKIMALNACEIFKYRHKLQKTLGVIFYRHENSTMINWVIKDTLWEYNKELEEINKHLSSVLDKPILKKLKRYNV